jgi:hypothetical protein
MRCSKRRRLAGSIPGEVIGFLKINLNVQKRVPEHFPGGGGGLRAFEKFTSLCESIV